MLLYNQVPKILKKLVLVLITFILVIKANKKVILK